MAYHAVACCLMGFWMSTLALPLNAFACVWLPSLNQQLMIFGLQAVVCKSLAKLRAERELTMSAVAGCP
jgi:hypothetical protein